MSKDHHRELARILSERGWGTTEAAQELSRLSGDEISGKTVRNWLADRSSDSARRCPGWSVALLKEKRK